jgi:hypothetical protein
MGDAMAQMTWDELRQLPSAVDLKTAGRALGIGRSKIYEMAKKGELQQTVRVLKLGRAYRVVTADLYRVLGVSIDSGSVTSAGSPTDLHVAGDAALPEHGRGTGIRGAFRPPDGARGQGTGATTRQATRRAAMGDGNAAAS